jgi:PadR family transcriptional regulator PadR
MCQNGGHHRCESPGRVRGLAQAWVLLALAQGPIHGYELLERLPEVEIDPGFLYRTLRAMEEEGLVRSSWDTSGSGPARRVYTLTDEGRTVLRTWAAHIRRLREKLDQFLSTYKELEGGEKDAGA